MINLDRNTLHFHKAQFLLIVWGLLILLSSVMSRYFDMSLNSVLFLWGGVTLLGLIAQAISLVRGLGQNYAAWVAAIAAGWLFTLYVVKLDNGAHLDLYSDIAGVWLILLGLAYLATAFQVVRLHLALAALHIAAGLLLELSARRIMPVSFLDANSTLIFGLVAGLGPLVAALPVWYRPGQPETASA